MFAVCDGDIAKPNEQPVKNISSGIIQNASDGPARAIRPIVVTVPHMPAIIRRRGPTRLYRRLVSCTPIMPPSASVKVERPEWIGGEAEAVLQQQRYEEQRAHEPARRRR